MSQEKLDISLVIPLFNEEESLRELIAWIDKVMKKEGFSYEAIMIDDGSSDDSWKVVQEIAATNPSVKGLSFCRNYGLEHAKGKY